MPKISNRLRVTIYSMTPFPFYGTLDVTYVLSQLHIKYKLVVMYSSAKWLKRQADYPSPSNTKVKNAWILPPIPLHIFMSRCLETGTIFLTFLWQWRMATYVKAVVVIPRVAVPPPPAQPLDLLATGLPSCRLNRVRLLAWYKFRHVGKYGSGLNCLHLGTRVTGYNTSWRFGDTGDVTALIINTYQINMKLLYTVYTGHLSHCGLWHSDYASKLLDIHTFQMSAAQQILRILWNLKFR